MSGNVGNLDDDQIIHEAWKKRFTSLFSQGNNIRLLYFSTSEELKVWVKNNSHQLQSSLFLLDFELIGTMMNGIELAVQFKLLTQTIIVTGKYGDATLIQQCENHGLKNDSQKHDCIHSNRLLKKVRKSVLIKICILTIFRFKNNFAEFFIFLNLRPMSRLIKTIKVFATNAIKACEPFERCFRGSEKVILTLNYYYWKL